MQFFRGEGRAVATLFYENISDALVQKHINFFIKKLKRRKNVFTAMVWNLDSFSVEVLRLPLASVSRHVFPVSSGCV